MKSEKQKGLHSIGKQGLPSNSGSLKTKNGGGDIAIPDESSEPYKPGSTPGMEHIESMVDDMSDEEQSHAHKHLSDKMVQKKGHKLPGEHMDDFDSAMGEES